MLLALDLDLPDGLLPLAGVELFAIILFQGWVDCGLLWGGAKLLYFCIPSAKRSYNILNIEGYCFQGIGFVFFEKTFFLLKIRKSNQ